MQKYDHYAFMAEKKMNGKIMALLPPPMKIAGSCWFCLVDSHFILVLLCVYQVRISTIPNVCACFLGAQRRFMKFLFRPFFFC